MSYPEINKISNILNSIHDLTGLRVLWKNLSGSPPLGIPLSQSIHYCKFCLAVQKKSKMLEKCKINDDALLTKRAKDLKHPFLNTCHGGALELIVPIFNQDHNYGLFIFGPVRMPDAVCPYNSLSGIFNNLPVYDEKLFNAVQTILEYLIVDIVKYYRLLKKSSSSMANNEKIRQSQYFIMTNYHLKLTAPEAAKKRGLSTSRFLHLFKEKTGITFTAYINKIRMENAARMLLETDYKIIQIAYQVSFDTESYFCSL
ncbi:MAG: PocR ligand-binding domain-containing protein, partial [Victivallaceae bacterium]|nr:PocR ligand-binding domain-containing protein [Victivallaceae bacterium]